MKSSKKNPKYTVVVGDSDGCFGFDDKTRKSYLETRFRQRARSIAIFPGLVLKDDNGDCWKPELRIHLVPAENPEE